jgi:hypothetical protein
MNIFRKIFLACVLTSFISSCSQNKSQYNDLLKLNLKGDIKQIKQFTYIAIEKFGEIQKGEIQPNIFFPENQNMILVFDNNGYIKEKENFDKAGIYNGKIINNYNEQKIIISVIGYNNKGSINYSQKGIYDAEKMTVKSIINYPEDYSVQTIDYYDNSNRKIKIDWFREDGKLSSRTIFKYDKKGNIIEENIYTSDGKLYSKNQNIFNNEGYKIEKITSNDSGQKNDYFKYDDFGNIIEEYSNKPGILVNKYIYKYKYDSKNNWVERVSYINGELPVDFTERNIEYN